MKHATLTALATALVLVSGSASAADDGTFGRDGQVIISGERLFGLGYNVISQEEGRFNTKQTTSGPSFSLLWPTTGPTSTPYLIPHAAIDFVFGGGVTLGGSLGFASSSGSTTTEPVNGPKVDTDAPTTTVFLLQPRVGYVLPLSDTFAFWPRLGITYYNVRTEQTTNVNIGGIAASAGKTTTTLFGLGLDLEAMFVYTPVNHFGITLTPLVDIPLTGSASVESTPPPPGGNPPDGKYKYTTGGALLGVLGYI